MGDEERWVGGWEGTVRGRMGILYLWGWPDEGEQDWQQHQPVEQPQQRQDGEHCKEVPGGAAGRAGKCTATRNPTPH